MTRDHAEVAVMLASTKADGGESRGRWASSWTARSVRRNGVNDDQVRSDYGGNGDNGGLRREQLGDLGDGGVGGAPGGIVERGELAARR